MKHCLHVWWWVVGSGHKHCIMDRLGRGSCHVYTRPLRCEPNMQLMMGIMKIAGHMYPHLQWHWKPSMLVRQVPPFLQTLLAHELMLVPGPPVVVSKSEIFCVCVPVSSVAVFVSVLVSANT